MNVLQPMSVFPARFPVAKFANPTGAAGGTTIQNAVPRKFVKMELVPPICRACRIVSEKLAETTGAAGIAAARRAKSLAAAAEGASLPDRRPIRRTK